MKLDQKITSALSIVMRFALFFSTTSAQTNNLPHTEQPVIELGAPFRNGAVLQRDMKCPVWGWSTPGSQVTVEFAMQKKSTTANQQGKWMVELDPLKASFDPEEMKISESGGKSLMLKNLLVGEVWFASGQSNMQWLASKCDVALLQKRIIERVASGQEKPPVIREAKITDYFATLHPIEHANAEWREEAKDMSGIAYSFAYHVFREVNVPIGILNCSFSETSIQAWTPRDAFREAKDEASMTIQRKMLETDPSSTAHKTAWSTYYSQVTDEIKAGKMVTTQLPGNLNGNRDASWLFNARMNPMIPFAVRGGIWNQGYANINEGIQYYHNLHNLIRGWRSSWGRPEMPVYFNQFYCPGPVAGPSLGGMAEMRLGTWMARDIPHVGMASQIDITGSIHYFNKTLSGQRLALHALKNQYGKKITTDGPMFRSYKVEGNSVMIQLDHARGGLVVAETGTNEKTGLALPTVIPGGDGQVKLFYLAGADRVWHPADVKIDGETLIVSSAHVKMPRGVSYGTGGIGKAPNIYNQALLPLTPFIHFDHQPVLSSTWPDSPIKIAGEEVDPSTVGLLNEYRKMPILSSQFVDHAVLQAGQPIVFWGSALHDWGYEAKGKGVIHVNFDGMEKTIPVTSGMSEWSVTLPAMEAGDKPRKLTVRFTIGGELAHERVIQNIVIGDVWYVAGYGSQPIGKMEDPVKGPIRIMTRMAKGFLSARERRYSVATSTTPRERFASYWGEPIDNGFASQLASAIHAKTGNPVGIIFMDGDKLELKHWMNLAALAQAPTRKDDYENIAAITVGTPFYQRNAERYINEWKKYWSDYIPSIIATKRVPDAAAWGSFPKLDSELTSDATQTFNCLVSSFRKTQLKGIIFLTEQSMTTKDEGRHFGTEITALANAWKEHFQSATDPHFFYTYPTASLAARITKPTGIHGSHSGVEISAWHERDKKGAYIKGSPAFGNTLIETILKSCD